MSSSSSSEFMPPNEFGVSFKKPLQLMEHQIPVIEWMKTRESLNLHGISGGIASLEMGLGKTIISLTLIMSEYVSEKQRPEYPTLVVVPLSALYTWKEQIELFFGDTCKYLIVRPETIGQKAMQQLSVQLFKQYHIIITNYETLRGIASRDKMWHSLLEYNAMDKLIGISKCAKPDPEEMEKIGDISLFNCPYRRIIVDESHHLTNHRSQLFYTMMCLWSHKKWCLTGTPIRNHCFSGRTKIITDQGNMTIKSLVDKCDESYEDLPNILSFNRNAQIFEYKSLLRGWKTEHKGDMFKIILGRKKIECTPDHPFLTTNGYVNAENLHVGDQVIFYSDEQSCSEVLRIMNYDQEQIFVGSFLGNGRVTSGKHDRVHLSVSHGKFQEEYCKWKASLMKAEIREYIDNRGFKNSSNAQIMLRFYVSSLYWPHKIPSDKTYIPQSIIDRIDNLALAIWFMDNGYMYPSANAIDLTTHSFDTESHVRLVKRLFELDIHAEVKRKTGFDYIHLNMQGTRKLLERIWHYVHPNMYYKIYSIGLVNFIRDSKQTIDDIFHKKEVKGEYKNYYLHPVTTILKKDVKKINVYDIEVDDNHNFIIANINDDAQYGPVVSNCEDIYSQCKFLGFNRIIKAKDFSLKLYKESKLYQCILYMTKEDAGIDLPEKKIITIPINLKDKEAEVYDFFKKETQESLDGHMNGCVSFCNIITLLTRLRQCCIAPHIITSKSESNNTELTLSGMNNDLRKWLYDSSTTAGIDSAKISTCMKLIGQVIPKDEKVLVFTGFKRVIDIMEMAMQVYNPSFEYEVIDGSVTGEKRSAALERFRTDPKKKVLFLTTKTGSESLNLTIAPNVIKIEPDWTSAIDDQAESRSHRMGQTKTVMIYRLVVENSIEQKMLQVCERKKELMRKFICMEGKKSNDIRLDAETVAEIIA